MLKIVLKQLKPYPEMRKDLHVVVGKQCLNEIYTLPILSNNAYLKGIDCMIS